MCVTELKRLRYRGGDRASYVPVMPRDGRYRWIAGFVVLASLVAACSGPHARGPSSASPSASAPLPAPGASSAPANREPVDPLALVGSWHVEAAGEEPGAILQLGAEFRLWRRCGDIFGGWRANRDGLFVT